MTASKGFNTLDIKMTPNPLIQKILAAMAPEERAEFTKALTQVMNQLQARAHARYHIAEIGEYDVTAAVRGEGNKFNLAFNNKSIATRQADKSINRTAQAIMQGYELTEQDVHVSRNRIMVENAPAELKEMLQLRMAQQKQDSKSL